ncbi:MAG: chemotaxis protein CheW [Candidatus Magnetomorum sp.]|nr:chemotaxis protein CheW [Candidatus Magnetomorum sp.]
MSFQQEMNEEFAIEAKEHLDIMESELLILEKLPENSNTTRIAKIFRSIHTVKGASAFLGFDCICELSHIMETLLGLLRSGSINVEEKYIDVLLKGTDTLNTLIENLKDSNDYDIDDIKQRIQVLIDSTTSPESRREMETTASLKDLKGQSVDFDISEYTLKNVPASNTYIYVLTYSLHDLQSKEGISPLKVVNNLLKNGYVIDSKLHTDAKNISKDEIYAHPLMYHVLFATAIDPGYIESAINLAASNIRQVDRVAAEQKGSKNKHSPKKEAIHPVSLTAPQMAPTMPVQKNRSQKPSVSNAASGALPQKSSSSSDHPDTIRIHVDILDQLMTLAGELVLVRNQHLLAADKSDPIMNGISQRLDIVTSELQETIMRTRMQPVGNVFSKLPRIVRDLSKKLGKQIEISMLGQEVELDKTILESLSDPLIHLVRNSCDHGIETPDHRKKAGKKESGQILIKAYHEAGQINIMIKDDGKGIHLEKIKDRALLNGIKTQEELSQMTDKEINALIMVSGFSTAEAISDVSGRGVGMDVVKTSIEQLGGSLDLESTQGEGTNINLRLPLTLAIIPCLVVVVDGFRYAIPQVNLEELVSLYKKDVYTKIECAGEQEVYRLRGQLLPMIRMSEVLARYQMFTEKDRSHITESYRKNALAALQGEQKSQRSLTFAVVKIGSRRFGLIVDKVIGTEEIVVKPMHSAIKNLDIYSGATVMGDGKVALILDIEGIARHTRVELNSNFDDEEAGKAKEIVARETQTVLLIKSGTTEQFAIPLPLVRRIEKISIDQIEKIGNKEFITIDDVSTRIIRLEEVLSVSPCMDKKTLFLLLPKHIKRPFGILLSAVVDTAETPMQLNIESYMEDGLLGTAIVQKRLTLFLDIYRLIERVEPDWFDERKKQQKKPDGKKKILLVEDTLFLQQLEKRYLEADGYEVTVAGNGKEGLSILSKESFDLIVSDIEMPEMNGWEFIKAVRNDQHLKNIPAMAVTALDTEADRIQTLKAGFDAYQVKIDRERMLMQVSDLINGQTVPKSGIDLQEKLATEKPEHKNRRRDFCTFWLSGRLFGVDILGVKEITSLVEFTPVFHSATSIKGYVNIRGQVHLVVNLKRLLSMDTSDQADFSGRVILFKTTIGESFGVLVDRISDVVRVSEKQIEETRNISDQNLGDSLEPKDNELITGVCKLEDNLLVILNARRFLKAA